MFYIESGTFNGTAGTQLFERTAASGFAAETSLFSYATPVSGSFVRVLGGTIFFGENSGGTIRSVNTDGTSPALIATVANNYDLVFSGSLALLSANPGGFNSPDNKVFSLDLADGHLDTVLDTGGDYSGPITVDAAGDLLYGATTFGSISAGGVYKFTLADIQSALDADPQANDTSLTMGKGTRIFANGSNGYLGRTDDQHVYALASPFGAAATITRFNLDDTNAAGQAAGQTNTGPFFGATDATDAALFVAVTDDFSTGPSAVFRVVPEPSPTSALLLGSVILAGAAGLSRKRKKNAAA